MKEGNKEGKKKEGGGRKGKKKRGEGRGGKERKGREEQNAVIQLEEDCSKFPNKERD